VSSQFDVAPSLLAFLSHGYGLRTPREVTWVGTGLDLEPSFRNLHAFPMKQTRAELVDFVAGEWLLSRGALYRLRDGLHMEAATDAAARSSTAARFRAFEHANSTLAIMYFKLRRGVPPEYAKQDQLDSVLCSMESKFALQVGRLSGKESCSVLQAK